MCVIRSPTNSSSMADRMNTKTLAGRTPFQHEGQSVTLQEVPLHFSFFFFVTGADQHSCTLSRPFGAHVA